MATSRRGIKVARLLFGFAGVFALASLYILFLYVSKSDERALDQFDTAKVLVAVESIAKGTSLSEANENGLIEIQTYPAKSLPTNSLEQVLPQNSQLVALSEIAPGEVLVGPMFGERVKPTISLDIPVGKVAITVELNYASKVGSFLRPGVNVAVYSIETSSNAKTSTTNILFRSIQVLAVGEEVAATTATAQTDIANFITLAVPYDQASKLIQATEGSVLYLALLNDSSLVGSTGTNK